MQPTRIVQIYTLGEPSSGEVRYVGQSTNATKRLAWHKSAARRGCKGRVYNWIRDVQRRGVEPIMSILEECPEIHADDREMYWIAHYRETTDLCNCTDGGGGIRGFQHTQEFRRKISSLHSNKVLSEETKRRVSASKLGAKLSEEHRRKISEALTGREVSDSTRRKISDRMKGNQYCKGLKRSPEDKLNKSLAIRGEKSPLAKFTNAQVEEIRELVRRGAKQAALAELFNVSRPTICRIVAKKVYK